MSGIMVAVAGHSGAAASGGGGALAVAANSTITQGSVDGLGETTCLPFISLTPSGGTPPYSFLNWTQLSGPAFLLSFDPDTPPWTTIFQSAGSAHKESVYRATVQDAVGATAFVDIDVIANPV